MAYDFPNSPTIGQVFGNYTWDGGKWGQSAGGAIIPASNPPLMDGAAAIGSSIKYAREDHVHPTDTSRAPLANVIINGDFRINQGVYVSAAVLAAGAYGHDQWKAGASGGDYSFTQLKSSTQITIASGKSLIQPIEDVNVVGGSYVLSWTGTAQARAGVNTLTPSGSYAVSPLLITAQTAGTAMSVEFNSGTLGTVKLESGANATPFIMRPYDQELATCQRYYVKLFGEAASGGPLFIMATAGGAGWYCSNEIWWPVQMRAIPTVGLFGPWTYTNTAGMDPSGGGITAHGLKLYVGSAAAGAVLVYPNNSTAGLYADARL